MKTVAIYVAWILGCSFVTFCVAVIAINVFASMVMNPPREAVLTMAVTLFLTILAGPVIGFIAARYTTRKRPRRFFDSDDPYSID
jgi:hypothetical protein